MEVVLATGEVLRTGFGHYGGAKATNVYKWGLGPYLDGLFTQSNFGIVTKIGVSLMPVPEAFEACYFSCNSEGQLGPLIEGIQQLIVWGTFQGPMNLLHRNIPGTQWRIKPHWRKPSLPNSLHRNGSECGTAWEHCAEAHPRLARQSRQYDRCSAESGSNHLSARPQASVPSRIPRNIRPIAEYE
jgi:hypothetical protein